MYIEREREVGTLYIGRAGGREGGARCLTNGGIVILCESVSNKLQR